MQKTYFVVTDTEKRGLPKPKSSAFIHIMSQSIDIGGIFCSSSSTTYLGLCNYVFLVYLSSGCVATGRVKNSFRQFVYIGKGISPSCLFFFHIHSINGISLGSFQQSVDSQWSSTWLTYQATSTGKSHLGHSC